MWSFGWYFEIILCFPLHHLINSDPLWTKNKQLPCLQVAQHSAEPNIYWDWSKHSLMINGTDKQGRWKRVCWVEWRGFSPPWLLLALSHQPWIQIINVASEWSPGHPHLPNLPKPLLHRILNPMLHCLKVRTILLKRQIFNLTFTFLSGITLPNVMMNLRDMLKGPLPVM